MFGREIYNGIPSIRQPPTLALEASKDRDIQLKEYHKQKVDEKRQAKQHKLERGDTVLLRNQRKGALQPNFTDQEFEVVDLEGGTIHIKSNETGKSYIRNSTHLKKLDTPLELPENLNEKPTGSTLSGERINEEDGTMSTDDTFAANNHMLRRQRKTPVRYEDYVL